MIAEQATDVKPEKSGKSASRTCDLERRCIVTGAIRPREDLIRFVIGPDRQVWPDLDEKLPGRGLWVGCDVATLETAIRKNHFAKAAREAATCPPGLIDTVRSLLRQKLLQLIGLARSSGLCVMGFAQVEPALKSGQIDLLLLATDAGADGPGKLLHRIDPEKHWKILTAEALGKALGHDHLVYVGLKAQPLTTRIGAACKRLSAFQPEENIAPEPGLAQIDANLTECSRT